MNQTALGIDLGGTHIKGALLHRGEVVDHYHTDTNDLPDTAGQSSQDQWQQAMRGMIDAARQQFPEQELAIGLAAPGIPDAAYTMIKYMPGRLQGLEDLRWADFLGEPRVPVLNDAMAALLAESRLGAAQNAQNVVLLTLGTGVGGGLLINGKPFGGTHQWAGHIGHTVADSSGFPDITRMPGSIEEAIGNASLPRRSMDRYHSTHDLVADYRRGDPFASFLWLTAVQNLACTLASLVNLISPEVIVLGGGITRAGDALYGPLASFMGVYEWRPGDQRTPIRQAKFDDYAGAVGAALFALEGGG
jgi:glucokinase